RARRELRRHRPARRRGGSRADRSCGARQGRRREARRVVGILEVVRLSLTARLRTVPVLRFRLNRNRNTGTTRNKKQPMTPRKVMRRQLFMLATLSLALPATFDAAAQTRLRPRPAQSASSAPREGPSGERQFVPVTDKMLKDPAPGDWLMWRRTLNGWGYSPLKDIDKGNVAKLQQVWAHELGMGIQESTPLVYDGVD